MKSLFGFITASLPALFAAHVFSQNINTPDNFPDPNFRRVIEEFMGVPPGGEFTAADAAAQTGTLQCSSRSISNMAGLQYFTGLTSLCCVFNQLTSLDISRNTALAFLNCSGN
jgi:Leucine-rich repeat (LRR) protein